MKKIILTFVLISIISNVQAQIKMLYDTEKNEKEKIERFINSGYKNINIYRIDVDEVEWQSDTTLLTEIKISDNGKSLTEINQSPYSKTVVQYDGNIVSREIFNQSNQLAGKTLYSYNNAGMIEKRELYFGDIKAFDEIYEIEGNQLVKAKYYTSDGMLINYSDFEYDSRNNMLKENKYNSNGETEYVYEYTYNSDGSIKEERIIMPDGKKTIVNYVYGKNKYITDKITKDSDGKIMSSLKYEYDGKKSYRRILRNP